MKAYKNFLLIIFSVFFLNTPVFSQEDFVSGEFIVKLKNSKTAKTKLNQILKNLGLMERERINENTFFLKRADAENISGLMSKRILEKLFQNKDVEYVEPNYLYYASLGSGPPHEDPGQQDMLPVIPNDPMFSLMWGLNNLGQDDSDGQSGKMGADSLASYAWNLSTGSKNIIVGIVDTGINYLHPDLQDNIWSEIVDGKEIHGYSAVTEELDPMDDNGHGSHVAGTIGATGNNGLGITGINWDVQLMGLKFLRSSGSGRLSDAIKCIQWGIDHGVNVMNHSYGGGGRSQAMADIFKKAQEAGIVMVAAAGNNRGNDNDERPVYPANYEIETLLTVASTNNQDEISDFSNVGFHTVDLAAPGENILSTWLEDKYNTISGTSMATPHVTGAVALLLAQRPYLTPAQVYKLVTSTVDKKSQFSGKFTSEGRLNIQRLLRTDYQEIE